MNLVKTISLFSFLGLMTACGSAVPPNYGAAGFGSMYYPQYTGNNFATPYPQSGGGEPIYSNGQLLGYKYKTPMVNASGTVYAQNIANLTLTGSTVNVGERLVMDLSHSNYEVLSTRCGIFSINTNLRKNYSIPGGQIMINGQPVANGSVATTAGTVYFKPTLNQLPADCTILTYGVYLNNAVYKESCTGLNGQLISCP